MKKLTLIIGLALGVMSCKKEEVKPTQSNYEVFNYVSEVPMYSVKIHNDTLTCVAENNTFEYVKVNESQYKSSRVYWNSTQSWTIWNENKISYFSNNTLYITF